MPDVIVNPADPTSDQKVSWYRRLYLRVEGMSGTPYAVGAMVGVSVIDGSIFPIPPFVLLVPMVLATPKRWWKLALYGTLASLVGGAIGYYLGILIANGATHFFSFNPDAPVNRFGIHSSVGQLLGQNFWVLSLLCSVLPTPFKVVAIGSGVVKVPFGRFMLAALIGRLARFFAVASVIRFAGPQARRWRRV